MIVPTALEPYVSIDIDGKLCIEYNRGSITNGIVLMPKTKRIEALLCKGYLPRELPPPFATTSFRGKAKKILKEFENAKLSLSNKEQENFPFASHPAIFDMARRGHARRLLSIPNPVNQLYLAIEIVERWDAIVTAIDRSNLSITKVRISDFEERAVPLTPFSDLAEYRLKAYATKKHILQADIASFYHSIYTHSIPWALHGKEAAKQNRSRKDPSMFGNALDFLVRQSQDGQTKGIPVGPDSSRIISEVILADIDCMVQQAAGNRIASGFRYIDDIFICTNNGDDSDFVLSALKDAVHHFELELNPQKTAQISAIDFNEEVWPQLLDPSRLPRESREQRQAIFNFFCMTLDTARKFTSESIASYAIKATTSAKISELNWDVYEAFLYRTAREHTNAIDLVTKIICTYVSIGYSLSSAAKDFVNEVIIYHSRSNHHFEVAWALWFAISLNLKLSDEAASSVQKMENSVCALLALHAQHKKLFKLPGEFGWLDLARMNPMRGRHWLLIYEGVRNKWLAGKAADVLANDPFFSRLLSTGVRFYTTKAHNRPIQLPRIDHFLRQTSKDLKKAVLPGNVYYPKKDSQRKTAIETLGGDYFDDEEDYFDEAF